jgi:cytochrome b-561 domain-containing protein 2
VVHTSRAFTAGPVRSPRPHLHSFKSSPLGLVSWIFVLLSQCLGLAAAKAQAFSALLRPVYVKFLHNFFGLLGYIFGIVSLCYGLETGGFKRYSSETARMGTYYLLGLTTTWSILAALKSAYDQLKIILF